MFYTGEFVTTTDRPGRAGAGRTGRGPGLAAALAGVDPRAVPVSGLVEVARAARALTSWAQAVELSVVAELADRPAVRGEFAADEVAAGLTLTRRAANAWVSLAFELCARLPGTWAALRAGTIDLAKARVIAAATATLGESEARRVEAEVLERAPGQTTGQLAARAARAAAAVDPDAARERYRRARRDRRVEFGPGVDGTADLAGLGLDPDTAAAAYARIDAHARAAKDARDTARATGHDTGDERGMDEFRADAYVDLLLGMGLDDQQERDADEPGTDPASDVEAGAEADVVPAGCAYLPGSQSPAAPSPAAPSPAARIGLTVPLTTLLGLAETPGELAGYGPVIADIARRVAAAATGPADQWCWTVTDDAGRVVHQGRTAYRPTGALREHLEARDRTCRAPGCRQPAARCDVDHTIPHDTGGTTCACNTGLLCRHHHRMKHQGGWHLHQPRPGTFTWTSPTGNTYTRGPGDDYRAEVAPRPDAGRWARAGPR